MKFLILLCSHEFHPKWVDNIKILHDYLQVLGEVHYCGISNQDDFHHYEDIISYKYKIINPKRQFSKVCDFISTYKSELEYDWYIKIRPDMKLLQQIPMDSLLENAINARARVYHGPRKINYGMSVNGEGGWINAGDRHYSETEHDIILDDMFFMFHHTIVGLNAFNFIEPFRDKGEWEQTHTFLERNIPLNVIGIHLENTKYNVFSGNTL